MPKNMFPIVIAYNGRDHFVPTIPCSEKDYLAWKVHKEFGSLAAATLLVTKELDRPSLPAGAAQGIKAIEKAIEENLPKISKKAFQYYNTLARRTTTHCGPAVQVAGSVPGTVGSSSSQQPPGPSTSSASQGAAEQEEQLDIPKGYKCDHCGKLCQRKLDLRGHLWSKHHIGDPIVCNLGACDNKSFSHESSLKQHQRTQHKGDYKFECEKCNYKTDSGSSLTSHYCTKHKILEKDDEGNPMVFTCNLCEKEFSAQHLLTKHQKEKNCVKKKIHKCPHCPRKYKTLKGKKYHIKHYHEGKKHPCPQCGILFASKSMRNHLRLHTSNECLRRARRFNAKLRSRQLHFKEASRKLGKRDPKKKDT